MIRDTSTEQCYYYCSRRWDFPLVLHSSLCSKSVSGRLTSNINNDFLLLVWRSSSEEPQEAIVGAIYPYHRPRHIYIYIYIARVSAVNNSHLPTASICCHRLSSLFYVAGNYTVQTRQQERAHNENIMLTFWRRPRKLGEEKWLSGGFYTKSYTVAYAQGCVKMSPQSESQACPDQVFLFGGPVLLVLLLYYNNRQTWCVGFLLFPRFSSFGRVMSDQC